MRLFTNGTTKCAVLEQDDHGRALIKLCNGQGSRYVVVWGYSDDRDDWNGGSYFDDLRGATACFYGKSAAGHAAKFDGKLAKTAAEPASLEDWCGGSWLETWLIDTLGEFTGKEMTAVDPLGDSEPDVFDGVVFTLGNGRKFKAIFEEVTVNEGGCGQ